jgi:hypothetical protein
LPTGPVWPDLPTVYIGEGDGVRERVDNHFKTKEFWSWGIAFVSTGDWGELSEADKQKNEHALRNGAPIRSAYPLPSGEKVWVITEADRSVTTLLLPSEY